MPWGAWVTCEETVNGPDVGPDFTGTSQRRRSPSRTATSSRCRSATSPGRPVQPAADQAGRPVRARGRLVRPAGRAPLPDRGQLRVRLRASTATGAPRNPMEVGRLLDGGTLQMLKVKGVDNAHLEAQQVNGTTYDVEWVDIAAARRRVRPHARPDRPDPEQHRAHPREQPGLGTGRGVLLPARGPGVRRRRRLLHLDPGRRGGGAAATRTPPGSATVPVRSGRTTSSARSSRCCSSRPGRSCSTCPTT